MDSGVSESAVMSGPLMRQTGGFHSLQRVVMPEIPVVIHALAVVADDDQNCIVICSRKPKEPDQVRDTFVNSLYFPIVTGLHMSYRLATIPRQNLTHVGRFNLRVDRLALFLGAVGKAFVIRIKLLPVIIRWLVWGMRIEIMKPR